MPSYRAKPVVVDAFQFKGTKETLPEWFIQAEKEKVVTCIHCTEPPGKPHFEYMVHTPEGSLFIKDRDYVYQGINGEIYPCKPHIFEATYELAE